MNRERLPNRRFADGVAYEHEGQKYHAHIGYYPDGRVAEIFVTGSKIGTSIDTGVREASTALSIGLQHGADFDTIRRALPRDPQGKPLGAVGAIMDLIASEVAR
jgi:hypothetical protein